MTQQKIATISERMQELIRETGARAVDICASTGIAKSSMSMYINGTVTPKGDNIIKIADYFNVDVRWLQGYDCAKHKTIAVPAGLMPPPNTVRRPRLGNVSCGVPLDSPENFDGYDDVPEDIQCDYTLKCSGDSMIGARIHDGDIVYVHQQPIVPNGSIAVVLVNGFETLLKRVYITADSITLVAENPASPPLVFTRDNMNNVTIIGKAVGFFSPIR